MSTGRAIVSHGPLQDGKWKLEDVDVGTLKDDELLVQIIASGICHTDVVVGGWPSEMIEWPRVLGHEGSGYVKAVGSKVSVAKPGDPVLLSFSFCENCELCKAKRSNYCVDMDNNFWSTRKAFSLKGEEEPHIFGRFFGQSSFASLTVAHQSSVVNAKSLIKSEEELKLFAPLGCGIQTGSGAIVNAAQATKDDIVAIVGLGGVGLSGLMAAKAKGCRQIIGIDKVKSRLDLAKELGATHTIDVSVLKSPEDIVGAVRSITDGLGSTVTMDTTGVAAVIHNAVEFTRQRGRYLQVGMTPPDAKIELPIFRWMCSGKHFIGAIEGDAMPADFIPELVDWYRQGNLPLEKLAKFFKADDWEQALHEMHTGETIKPILLW